MLETIIYAYLAYSTSDQLAESFQETFANVNFLSELEPETLIAINDALDEIKAAKILQKHAIAEFSEYHKALKKEIKEREEDYF